PGAVRRARLRPHARHRRAPIAPPRPPRSIDADHPMTRPADPLISVVAPVLNEIGLVDRFVTRTLAALDGERLELVIVDDGSTDGTGERLDELATADPRLRVLHLSRNFGHQAALTAGLEHAHGDAVV